MPTPITIPRLGWSMEEGIFAGWQKAQGAAIQRGEVLFELEGEKALQEIEAIDEGTLWIPPDAPRPGTVLKVGAVIGFLLAPGESRPAAIAAADPAPAASAVPAPTPDTPAESPSTDTPPPASPSIRRLARELNVQLSQVDGSGPNGRITEDDVRSAAAPVPLPEKIQPPPSVPAATTATSATPATPATPVATPRARRVAAERGIDWTILHGTGRDGRVRERDIPATPPHTATSPAASATPAAQWLPLTGRRQVIARRMQASRQNTVPVTITAHANAAAIVSLREQFRAADLKPVPAYHDILAKLTAECLADHLPLAARHERGGLILPDPRQIHLGLAVDTPDGLIVPVLRNIRQQSLSQLAEQSAACISRARAGRLTASDTEGSVFTISSLGSFGIDAFTPVINYPEVAILGVGAIRQQPVVLDRERLSVGQQLTLSLTFDHQAIDGAPAARFLQQLVRSIENAAAKLLHVPSN